jgi:hypothetical protein
LVIEVDGGQHADSEADKKRDAYRRSQGFRVLRLWNNDVLSNREGCPSNYRRDVGDRPLTLRVRACRRATPHPATAKLTSFAKPSHPSPARGEGFYPHGRYVGSRKSW